MIENARRGSATLRRVNIALVAAAFSTFAVLYCVQPLMPMFARLFHVSPAASSLSLSLTSGMLAVGMLLAGTVSEVWGRKSMMCWSLAAAALLTLGTAVAPTWPWVLITRALAGVALSGLPSVAMAYVSEEFDPRSGAFVMGLYISGTAFGGMAGRLLTAILTDMFSWRWAVGGIGMLALCSSVTVWVLLPPSRRFFPHEPVPFELIATMIGHLKERGLRWLFLVGLLSMGGFVSIYNYIGFRLTAPPYGLSQSAVGLIFIVYLVGMAGSAWAGRWAGRRGPGRSCG